MSGQQDLTQLLNQKYVIDACALLDFWGSVEGYRRNYDVDVAAFRAIWDFIAKQVLEGVIIIPWPVYKEVSLTTVEEFHKWLVAHNKLYVEYEEAAGELAQIVQTVPFYTSEKASLTDAMIVAIAKKRGLTVITSEHRDPDLNLLKPMIPNVCDKMEVPCMSLPQFFVAEGL